MVGNEQVGAVVRLHSASLSTSIRVLKERVEKMKSQFTEFDIVQMPGSTPESSKSARARCPVDGPFPPPQGCRQDDGL